MEAFLISGDRHGRASCQPGLSWGLRFHGEGCGLYGVLWDAAVFWVRSLCRAKGTSPCPRFAASPAYSSTVSHAPYLCCYGPQCFWSDVARWTIVLCRAIRRETHRVPH